MAPRGREGARDRQPRPAGHRARLRLRLQQPRVRHARAAGARRDAAARSCSTPPTACSCRAGRARASGGDRALRAAARARRGGGGRRRASSWRCTRTPSARSPTAPTSLRARRPAGAAARVLAAHRRGSCAAEARRSDDAERQRRARAASLDVEIAGARPRVRERARRVASIARRRSSCSACRGKVVVTGIGKSGIVGRKIAATLRQHRHAGVLPARRRGQPRRPRHARARRRRCSRVVEQRRDRRGARLLPLVRRLGDAAHRDHRRAGVDARRAPPTSCSTSASPEEACPLGLAPTASTTATMALGDALAVALLEERGFTAEDFALLHPGGSARPAAAAGRRPHAPRRRAAARRRRTRRSQDTIVEITAKRLGMTAVVDAAGDAGRASSPTATCGAALERAARHPRASRRAI